MRHKPNGDQQEKGSMIRIVPLLGTAVLVSFVTSAYSSDDTLKFFLAKADVVVACEATTPAYGYTNEAGVTDYVCAVRVMSVIRGKLAPDENPLRVTVMRFDDTGGVPEQGSKYFLFLDLLPDGNQPRWETADPWFGILPYTKGMERSLRDVSAAMDEDARWQPLRKIGNDETPENLQALMKVADGGDVEVACEAFSRLSDYSPSPELNEFLTRKMRDPNPKIALHAAIITCYSGDWSGFDMLVQHVNHANPDLRRTAIAQLVDDSQFAERAAKFVPLLVERLQVERDTLIIDRTIESLGSYPSPKTLQAVRPFLKHENEHVRNRARLTVEMMKRQLGREPTL